MKNSIATIERPFLGAWWRAAAALIMTVICCERAIGQPAPWLFSQDPTISRLPVRKDRTISLADTTWYKPVPGYEFEMAYDSTCHVNYLFTECTLNGLSLALAHWKEGRLAEGNAAYLTFNSHTYTFPVRAGDTIGFYRELRWYHPITQWQDTNSYFALDTLEYIVHLVRASDGAPIAQLDSTGIMARTTMGVPCVYGSRPLMALIRYVVPGSVQGDSAFIGITVRSKGIGKYNFTRLDNVTFAMSRQLDQAFYQNYLAYFSGTYSKRSVDDLAGPGDERFKLGVAAASGSNRDITIEFEEPKNIMGRISVGVYDINGQLLYSPYTSNVGSGTQKARYRFAELGTYFVALLWNDRIVGTKKISITR